jgi:hypothetical protein
LNEPKWKTFLCWGVVVAYLTVPLITYALVVASIELPDWHVNEHLKDFAGLGQWFQALTALIFGLAGLNSWDKTVYQKYNGVRADAGRGNHVASASDQRAVKPS